MNDKCSEVLAWKNKDMTTEESSAQITNTNQGADGTAYGGSPIKPSSNTGGAVFASDTLKMKRGGERADLIC